MRTPLDIIATNATRGTRVIGFRTTLPNFLGALAVLGDAWTGAATSTLGTHHLAAPLRPCRYCGSDIMREGRMLTAADLHCGASKCSQSYIDAMPREALEKCNDGDHTFDGPECVVCGEPNPDYRNDDAPEEG